MELLESPGAGNEATSGGCIPARMSCGPDFCCSSCVPFSCTVTFATTKTILVRHTMYDSAIPLNLHDRAAVSPLITLFILRFHPSRHGCSIYTPSSMDSQSARELQTAGTCRAHTIRLGVRRGSVLFPCPSQQLDPTCPSPIALSTPTWTHPPYPRSHHCPFATSPTIPVIYNLLIDQVGEHR